jgi:hypothetical protein
MRSPANPLQASNDGVVDEFNWPGPQPSDIHPILATRAVHPEFVSGVWGTRYARYEQDDWEAFKAAGHTHHHGWMRRAFVEACGGFVIHRADAVGNPLPSYIRPDYAICTRHGRQDVGISGSKQVCKLCGKELSKYTQASGRATGRSGKLIDVHPVLRNRLLAGHEPIFLCLEGCLKADAVAGVGRLAISVLSVTLWRADDEPDHWAQWLPLLKQAPMVYVIPDSDYQPKPGWQGYEPGSSPKYTRGGEVRYSTDRCVHWLRRTHGIDARFLVPPYLDRMTASQHNIGRFKVGIDDHIATGGNLDKWDRVRNPRGMHTWVYRRAIYRNLPGIRYDSQQRRDRDNLFLDWLEEFGGHHGYYSPEEVSRDLHWDRSTTLAAKQNCIKRGVLEVWDGAPKGEGKGNEPHLYQFQIQIQEDQSIRLPAAQKVPAPVEDHR